MSQSFYLQLTPGQLAKLSPADQERYFKEMATKHPDGYPLDIHQPITTELELALVRKWWNDKVAEHRAHKASGEGE